MSFESIDKLFGVSEKRQLLAKKKEERKKVRKADPDPFVFEKKSSKKKVDDVVIERVIPTVETRSLQDEAKIPEMDVIFHDGGKALKPEDAFKSMGFGTFIAALFHIYHKEVGYEQSDLKHFTTVIHEAIRLYGPDINVSDGVIGAASFHIGTQDVSPYHAMRAARVGIKENIPRSIFADLIVGGDSGMTVDTVTGTVGIADDVGLSKKATKAMSSLFQAKMSPKEEMVAVICELTDTNLEFIDDLEDEVVRWTETEEVPEINETNPFKSLSSKPGLLSPSPVAEGNQGVYQGVCKLLRIVETTKPDIIIVPGNNQSITGSYSSLGDCSRCIPLPHDLRHASPVLASINVVDFDEVIIGLRTVEIEFAEDDNLKRDQSINARSVYHGQFMKEYDRFRTEPHGLTKIGLKYVTLHHCKPLTAQELYNLYVLGNADYAPILMRASEYNLATLKGVKGSFVLTDIVAMVGVYFSDKYVKANINAKFIGKNGKIVSVTGFYTLKDMKTGAINTYSSWIQKYVLAKMIDVLYPSKGYGEKLLAIYLSCTSTKGKKTRDKDQVKTILGDLVRCYGKMVIDPHLILILTPSYSIKKTLKYTRVMFDNRLLEKMTDDLQGREPDPYESSESSDDLPPHNVTIDEELSDVEEGEFYNLDALERQAEGDTFVEPEAADDSQKDA